MGSMNFFAFHAAHSRAIAWRLNATSADTCSGRVPRRTVKRPASTDSRVVCARHTVGSDVKSTRMPASLAGSVRRPASNSRLEAMRSSRRGRVHPRARAGLRPIHGASLLQCRR